MKKTTQLLGILAMLAIIASSCKDEMINEPFENGRAIIQGTALVNTNFTNDTVGTIYENAPSDVHIYGIINSEDLVDFPSAGVNYGQIIIDTLIGANGSFTLVVPANSKGVTVHIVADDFRANQVQADTTVESKIFYLPSGYSEVVRDGMTRITEVTFFEK